MAGFLVRIVVSLSVAAGGLREDGHHGGPDRLQPGHGARRRPLRRAAFREAAGARHPHHRAQPGTGGGTCDVRTEGVGGSKPGP